jgi:hypothetical protein
MYRILRERKIVLLASKSFFLSGRNYLAVLNQTGGTVMVKSRYAQYVHLTTIPLLEFKF